MKADKKNRIHVVYSTDPNYNYEYNNETEDETLPPEKQNLRVMLDSKQRKGKTVTLVQGFVGREDDLKELAKLLAILSIQFSSERRYYLLSEEFVKSLQPSPFCFSP